MSAHIQYLPQAEDGEERYALTDLSQRDVRILRDALCLYSSEMQGIIPDREPIDNLHRIAAQCCNIRAPWS